MRYNIDMNETVAHRTGLLYKFHVPVNKMITCIIWKFITDGTLCHWR